VEDSRYAFQYCPKLVVFSADKDAVLLAQRYGEADFDGMYSFIGGKMEITDDDIIAGMRREKIEEIGPDAKIRVNPSMSYSLSYRKQDGSTMILPHFVALYEGGDIVLNTQEYSNYAWVPLDGLPTFEPVIETVPAAVTAARRLLRILSHTDFIAL
jgi:8-oxo-dGTP pyrophosphatase MutT (NUDIX family)